jgi:LPXTG-motif cell wall-anchored protein
VVKSLPPTGASATVLVGFAVALVVGGVIALLIRYRKKEKQP